MNRRPDQSRQTGEPGVLFVQADAAADEEAAAALAWLATASGINSQVIECSQLEEALALHPATIWFHWSNPPDLDAAQRLALDSHIKAGGGLLLTLAAVTLPAQLDWEDVAPNETTQASWSDEPEDLAFGSFSVLTRVRGLQSFRGHPLFEGLGSGAYTWDPELGERYVRYGYSDATWPKQGRVIAVQKSYIAMNAGRRLAWEYMIGDGWVLCVGGYVNFAARGRTHRPHLEHLIRNALERVAPNGGRARLLGGSWRRPEPGISFDPQVPLPPELPDASGAAFEAGDDISLEREATDETYTLAGSRALLVGRERTGHDEIWFHPNRAINRWALSILDATSETEAATADYRIEPGVITRRLSLAGQTVEERTTVAPARPAVLVELRPTAAVEPAKEPEQDLHQPDLQRHRHPQLQLSLESDLRLMWPYPPSSTGRLQYCVEGGAVGIRAETGEWLGVRVNPAPAVLSVANISDAERSRVRLQVEFDLSQPVRILLIGAAAGEDPASAVDPAGWARHRSDARQAQRGTRLPSRARDSGADPDRDSEVNEAIEWAKWRLSTYRVHVPGLGTSLVAGYAPSRPGDFSDGRPGYAWFFGRDAVWTSFASLAAGQSDVVREVLEFLGRHQDITGKILHECTTSGVVHYDAADSTPLYLLLAARYLAVTADERTVQREWPRIVRAYEFCLSTDSDGDGLIENSGVGHGWIEFGPFGGHHVSLYLAGVWVAALQELEIAARRLGKLELAEELAYRAAAARSSLELSFYDPLEGRYANGRLVDGSLDMTETVMTSVPLALGAIRVERCTRWLERVSSAEFTAPWGVRMLPRSHPDYQPDGYHAGAIWPLYSGWVCLAEYRAGRVESAERHWHQIMNLYRDYALGAWPEVLHGEQGRRIGVTPDQAWSTLMVLAPWIAGSQTTEDVVRRS